MIAGFGANKGDLPLRETAKLSSTAAGRALVDKVPADKHSNPARKQQLILSLLLAVVILVFYNPVAHNGFVFMDDSIYLLRNKVIQGGLTWPAVKWSFTTFLLANWHPLTWLSHALDCQLFGLNPAGHHYVSLLFHAGNAVLVFLILESATGLLWPSLIVAALFGLHPLTVESVAWAAERKNVLSMFFCLLALRWYTKYAQSERRSSYMLSVACFALGLMAKPQIISLPILLLLWDYWPLGRLTLGEHASQRDTKESSARSLVVDKVPFLVLSALSAVVTLVAQRSGNAVRTLSEMPVSIRLENCVVAYARYVAYLFWPARLAPMYPHPGNSLRLWQVGAAAILLAAITALAVWQRKQRFLLAGWLWFLIALVPMIGLVQVGEQAMADRYMYLSMLGLLIAVVWGCRDLVVRWRVPTAAWAVSAFAILLALGLVTRHQLSYWRDGETLWRYTLSVTDRNYMAHDNLATVLAEQGRADEAISEFRAAENLHQYSATEIISLGAYEQSHGHLQGAIEQYTRAAQSSGELAVKAAAWDRAALAEVLAGNVNHAAQTFENALAVKPDDPDALAGSAMLAWRAGNSALAVQRLGQLVKVSPGDVSLLLLAGALRQVGRDEDASKTEHEAQMISSNYAQAQETAHQFAAQFGVRE